MGNRRLELQAKLQEYIGDDHKVYFQPPESLKLTYPCFVYSLSSIDTRYADGIAYNMGSRYNVIYITAKNDESIPYDLPNAFEYCSFDRSYSADNLNHYSFTLYY